MIPASPRRKILIWHVHGAYLNTLAHLDPEWYVPIKPGRPAGYGGRGPAQDLPDSLREVPADRVRDLDLDLVIYQSPRNLTEDGPEILSATQQRLPAIYLEHNVPRPHPVDTRHPVDDPTVLLVHVTRFNRVMWDNGATPTAVVEHSVAIAPGLAYRGDIPAGITVVNEMGRRGRLTGLDLFLRARESVPLALAGMVSEEFGGLGAIPYRELHARVAGYRFLFSPMRYTSLPLAVIEGMTLGMPIVALATTELPTVLEDGVSGYCSCDLDLLLAGMERLIADPAHARRLGDAARQVARERFGLDRFARSWTAAFDAAVALRPAAVPAGTT